MKHGIVEGEPGIFPDPFARLLRTVKRLVTRRSRDDPARPVDDPPDATPESR